ncbi:MAG: GTPase RsgA [Bacilli bacterium]|jgi:ribosome biogenesis GTPase A|nr:GTPase RsgA [Bacilli bacterium]
MSEKCKGCGVLLQSVDVKKRGYVKEEKKETALYCERCYRLKHYRELRFDSLMMSNENILENAICLQKPIYFFVDFLHLSEEVLKWFYRITGPKYLVLSKVDLIPYSISLERLVKRIQELYCISTDILCFSVKKEMLLFRLRNHLEAQKEKKVLFLGMTNVGKSSALNALYHSYFQKESPVLVSKMPNTTQDFLTFNMGAVTIYDAPGFVSSIKMESCLALKVVPQKYIRPITLPLKLETRICLEDLLFFSQNLSSNHITFYGSNDLDLKRKYSDTEGFDTGMDITILADHDLVLPGIGFFTFHKDTIITLYRKQSFPYEIRASLFGGYND